MYVYISLCTGQIPQDLVEPFSLCGWCMHVYVYVHVEEYALKVCVILFVVVDVWLMAVQLL